MKDRLAGARYRLGMLSGRLDGVSPAKQLSKGLAFVTDASGRRISSSSCVQTGAEIRVRLQDGSIMAEVKDVQGL